MAHFEICETGDPYGSTWDATEYRDEVEAETGYGIFRGDLGYLYERDDLIAHLRRIYPDCTIYDRDNDCDVD